jgi:hypothetical protein
MAFLSTIVLPDATEPLTTQTVSLEGRSYVFKFDWNSRTDRWSVSLAAEDGEEILSGAVLVLNIDLLRTVPNTFDYVPPGQLIAGGIDDPNLETTNEMALFYIPSE